MEKCGVCRTSWEAVAGIQGEMWHLGSGSAGSQAGSFIGLGGSLEVGMGEGGGKCNSQEKTRMAGQGALTVQGATSSMVEPGFSRGTLGHPHDEDVRRGLP